MGRGARGGPAAGRWRARRGERRVGDLDVADLSVNTGVVVCLVGRGGLGAGWVTAVFGWGQRVVGQRLCVGWAGLQNCTLI